MRVVDGEFHLKGRSCFMGYLNNREETIATLTEDRFLKTGDLGYRDEDGFYFITGRRKEVIITSGGENIPGPSIEAQLLSHIPFLQAAVVLGNGLKYITALLTLQTQNHVAEAPSIAIHPDALK